MGVDFYACDWCGETFPDCGDFVSCGGCGKMWCSDECAEKDGFQRPDEDDLEEDPYAESSCKFCRDEDVADGELLKHCLLMLDISREDAVANYFGRG